MSNVLQFPSKAKPRALDETLKVPTTNRIVARWAEWRARKIAADMNPCSHNIEMQDSARARYVAALVEENEGA